MITEQNRWKNGGSYKKYYYTVKDISEITGRSIGTIRNDIYKKRLIMDDLSSVIKYTIKTRKTKKATDETNHHKKAKNYAERRA